MIYILFFLFLFFAMCYEDFFYSKKNFYFIVGFITVLIWFRYGIGVDYFNYIYAFNESANSFKSFLNSGSYSGRFEIGFSFISYIYSLTLIDQVYLISIYACLSFIFLSSFIIKYSNKPIASLFYYFSFFFLVYTLSAIRQGFSIAVFCCFAIPFLIEKKYIKYFFVVLFIFLFHKTAIILIVLPFLLKFDLKKQHVYVFILISLSMSVIFKFTLANYMYSFSEGYKDELFGFDFVSITLRLFLGVIILNLYDPKTANNEEKVFFKLYFYGLFLYLLLSFNSLISSRVSIYLRMVEIIIIIKVLSRYFVRIPKISIFVITLFLFIKTINTEISQGNYNNNIKFYNFPYVSIFNRDKILQYRDTTYEKEF